MSYVVIGAGYGDEGKGLMVDYLARQTDARYVARFNGGAQAGHTVLTPSGQHHVFHHIGSGTFAGAQTLLGKRFIVNPLMFSDEFNELLNLVESRPEVRVHSDASVSTIYDMLINAELETSRGSGRHGSCGVGINETVTRDQNGFKLRFDTAKAFSLDQLRDELVYIAQRWVPRRLKELGLSERVKNGDSPLSRVLREEQYEAHAIRLQQGLNRLSFMPQALYSDSVIFEGAQGLGLDEDLGQFPHVTRSLTGLPYAIELAAELGIDELTPVYVTRAYSTRHGAGHFPFEGEPITSTKLHDSTNVPNEWQGELRYAPLDITGTWARIKEDLKRSKVLAHILDVKINKPQIAITCLDQLGDTVNVRWGNGGSAKIASSGLAYTFGMEVRYKSYGRTAETVVQVDDDEV